MQTGRFSSTNETIRDGNGNPIGTKTTDTTVTVTPSGPTTVNITETTTITETNITNNTTTTTTQTTTLPNNEDQTTPPKDTEPDDAEIDDVPDIDLPEHEIPNTFDYQSWGGGTCPGDPSVSVLGYSLLIPVHTVCTGLSMLRPVVLIMAALASAFIIVGAVKE